MNHAMTHRPPAGEQARTISRPCIWRCGAAGCALWLAATAGLVHAPQASAQNFNPPDITGFTQQSERDADGDGDGVNETHIVKYANTHADSLVSMTTKGRTWAWSLDTRSSESGPENYVIRDSDCDGTFDEVYGLDEEFHVPECLK